MERGEGECEKSGGEDEGGEVGWGGGKETLRIEAKRRVEVRGMWSVN